jgi:hypothetical protein
MREREREKGREKEERKRGSGRRKRAKKRNSRYTALNTLTFRTFCTFHANGGSHGDKRE